MATISPNKWSWHNLLKSDESLTWTQRFFAQTLMYGKIPKHVALIMDGNRRYIMNNCISKQEGYARGFDKLTETLQWCLHLGIKEVTVFAFSLDNFQGTNKNTFVWSEELRKILEERDKLNEFGVCINVFGDIKKLPDDLVKLIVKSMLLTKQNNKTFLNVACSYTGHVELTNAFKEISNGIKNNELKESDLSVEILDNCMYTYPSPPPDLLICTSGGTRLNDFMLWQCSYTYIYFTSVLWPEFTAWDLMFAVFMYQRNYRAFTRYKLPNKRLSSRAEQFIENVRQNRLKSLYSIV